jgi:hypothetical protein
MSHTSRFDGEKAREFWEKEASRFDHHWPLIASLLRDRGNNAWLASECDRLTDENKALIASRSESARQQGGDAAEPRPDHDRIAAICELDGCWALRAPASSVEPRDLRLATGMLEGYMRQAAAHPGDVETLIPAIGETLRRLVAHASATSPTEAMLQAALDADIGTLDTPLRELYRLICTAMRRAEGRDA